MEAREFLKSLAILDIERLIPHELIDPVLFRKLKKLLSRTKYFSSPIIIDGRSGLILDGLHRVEALRRLGYKKVLCQKVDYSSTEIKVGTWLPVLSKRTAVYLARLGRKTSFEEGMRMLGRDEAFAMLSFAKGGFRHSYVFPSEFEDWLHNLVLHQRLLTFLKEKVSYAPDELAEYYLKKGKALLFRRSYSKKEILKAAKEGFRFPPKSTRHIIPNRILKVDIPMGWLRMSEKIGNRRLANLVKKRIENGEMRYYPEPTIVLHDMEWI